MRLKRTLNRTRGFLALGLFVSLIVIASSAVAETIVIEINNLTISPTKISAHLGDTVQWNNKDFVAHTATAHDQQWDVILPAHGTSSVKLEKRGIVQYYCKYHPTMKAEIDVK